MLSPTTERFVYPVVKCAVRVQREHQEPRHSHPGAGAEGARPAWVIIGSTLEQCLTVRFTGYWAWSRRHPLGPLNVPTEPSPSVSILTRVKILMLQKFSKNLTMRIKYSVIPMTRVYCLVKISAMMLRVATQHSLIYQLLLVKTHFPLPLISLILCSSLSLRNVSNIIVWALLIEAIMTFSFDLSMQALMMQMSILAPYLWRFMQPLLVC